MIKNIQNSWIKKNTNVLSSRTAMELKDFLVILEITKKKKKLLCIKILWKKVKI